MTAISRIYTPEGFVVASDSRKTNPAKRKDVVDGVQKIFPIPGTDLCYAITGIVQFTTSDGIGEFDFRDACIRAIETIERGESKSWPEYVAAVTRAIAEPLHDMRKVSTHTLSKPAETQIFLTGFYSRQPGCAEIYFRHGLTESESSGRVEDPQQMNVYGSGKIWNLLFKEDVQFSEFLTPRRLGLTTLAAAVDRARNEIRAHCDPKALEIDAETCWAIGEPVHIATITDEGFQWVPGFVPTMPESS